MFLVEVSQLLMVLFGDRLRFCQERRTRTLGPKCNLHILLSPEQTKHTQLNAFAFASTQLSDFYYQKVLDSATR